MRAVTPVGSPCATAATISWQATMSVERAKLMVAGFALVHSWFRLCRDDSD
jgi:hypothetical protein